MTTNILEMRGITKTFPGVKALSNVTLGVERGEVHAICGENGAGKSTLMKVLSGVYPHGSYDGDIVFENETVAFKDLTDVAGKLNACPAGTDFDVREAARGKPVGDRLDIRIGWAELLAKLIGGEPGVIVL